MHLHSVSPKVAFVVEKPAPDRGLFIGVDPAVTVRSPGQLQFSDAWIHSSSPLRNRVSLTAIPSPLIQFVVNAAYAVTFLLHRILSLRGRSVQRVSERERGRHLVLGIGAAEVDMDGGREQAANTFQNWT